MSTDVFSKNYTKISKWKKGRFNKYSLFELVEPV